MPLFPFGLNLRFFQLFLFIGFALFFSQIAENTGLDCGCLDLLDFCLNSKLVMLMRERQTTFQKAKSRQGSIFTTTEEETDSCNIT